jgi:prevent-host-death family protein
MAELHNMHDAKTHLSRLAERAAQGEEIVIARNGRPLARLVAIEEQPKRRKLGLWKDEHVWVSDDFDDPLPWAIQRHFEGEDDG